MKKKSIFFLKIKQKILNSKNQKNSGCQDFLGTRISMSKICPSPEKNPYREFSKIEKTSMYASGFLHFLTPFFLIQRQIVSKNVFFVQMCVYGHETQYLCFFSYFYHFLIKWKILNSKNQKNSDPTCSFPSRKKTTCSHLLAVFKKMKK